MLKLLPLLLLTGCISLHSDEVTRDHWQACERYCAPVAIKEACDSWKGNGCTCQDNRTIFFEQEDFDDE